MVACVQAECPPGSINPVKRAGTCTLTRVLAWHQEVPVSTDNSGDTLSRIDRDHFKSLVAVANAGRETKDKYPVTYPPLAPVHPITPLH